MPFGFVPLCYLAFVPFEIPTWLLCHLALCCIIWSLCHLRYTKTFVPYVCHMCAICVVFMPFSFCAAWVIWPLCHFRYLYLVSYVLLTFMLYVILGLSAIHIHYIIGIGKRSGSSGCICLASRLYALFSIGEQREK